jgi:hypothetical protein
MLKRPWLIVYSAFGYTLSAIALPWAFSFARFHSVSPAVWPATKFGLTAAIICLMGLQVACAVTMLAHMAKKWKWGAGTCVSASFLNLIPWFVAARVLSPMFGFWRIWAALGVAMVLAIAFYARPSAVEQRPNAKPDEKSQLKVA